MTENIYEKLSEERKQLQEQNLIPQWMSTGGYQLFKQKYEYHTNGRSVRGQFERIAKTAAKHVESVYPEAEQKFFDLMWNQWMSLSTPVFANMGTDRGMPVSCSGTIVDDSIDGFYSNLREVAILTKYGFGTSTNLSNIRPRGSSISIGGKANGVLPVIKEHVQAMRNVAQGTARRGAWAAYLDIEHGDFYEVADHLLADQDDLNIGWIIKNSFIERLNSKDEDAIARYQRALKIKMIFGKGYFCFIDKINARRPQMYVDKGMYVNASNLCLVGDTKVKVKINGETSEKLLKELIELHNSGKVVEVESYNLQTKTKEFKEVTAAALTKKNAKLIKITDSKTLKSIKCTPEHKIYTQNRGYVMAKDLKETDELTIK